MLEKEVGALVPQDAPLRRGDLVFWRGHVGILADASTLIHANGWHMQVVKEAFSEAKTRIAANGGGVVTSVRRV
jgi:cell wall-associated NlpC family hydrolase